MSAINVFLDPFIYLSQFKNTKSVMSFSRPVTFTNKAVFLACGHTVSLSFCPPGNSSNCNALTHGDMVSLDEGRFPALELNNRRLSVKNSFCRKNGVYTRSVGDSSF